jgi:hypothetical protein
LTGMVISVPSYETFSLIKNNILHQSKNYKNHFENSNFWGMWPLGHVGHVTYSFINMLFISTGIFVYHSINNTIPWVIWWWAPPTNFVSKHYRKCRFKYTYTCTCKLCYVLRSFWSVIDFSYEYQSIQYANKTDSFKKICQ